MEKRKPTFMRYIPSDGMALKFTRKEYNHKTKSNYAQTYYCPCSTIIDETELLSPVEEISMEEYDKWYEENSCSLAVGALIR